MNDQNKREKIWNYFKPFPKWTVVVIIIGVLIILFSEGKWMGIVSRKLLGVVFCGISGAYIFLYYNSKPSDQQIDAWLNEDLNFISKHSLTKLEIEEAQLINEPLIITGPYLYSVAGSGLYFKRGKDNIIRFTPINVSVINLTQNQVLRYSCIFDFINGSMLNESTEEFFYRDIVSVSTAKESIAVNIESLGITQLNAAETFKLTTTGGTSFSVLLRDYTLIEKLGGGIIPITHAEKAVQAIRKILREKKA